MVRPAAMSPLALLFAATAVLSAGCFDTSSTITAADYPTVLTVDPMLFRGSLQCGAPALARYVVTLTDVSAAPTTPLASSFPVACQNHLSFGDPQVQTPHVQAPHYYTANVDGYDRDDIVPAALGSRDMLDPSSGEIVAPKWMTTCGEVPPPSPAGDAEPEADVVEDGRPYNPLRYPTQVLTNTEVILHGCLALDDNPPPDASTEDGASGGGGDGPTDAGSAEDVATETSDVAEPDSSGPGREDGGREDGGGEDGGAEDGGGEASGGEASGGENG